MYDLLTLAPSQTPGLEIDTLSDGYVIHDPSSDRVHYLNPSSALIFELSDGMTTVQQMAEVMAECFALSHNPLQESIACVEQMMAEGLVYA